MITVNEAARDFLAYFFNSKLHSICIWQAGRPPDLPTPHVEGIPGSCKNRPVLFPATAAWALR